MEQASVNQPNSGSSDSPYSDVNALNLAWNRMSPTKIQQNYGLATNNQKRIQFHL